MNANEVIKIELRRRIQRMRNRLEKATEGGEEGL